MRIPEIKTLLNDCLDANDAAFIHGTWGIGKSQAVAQVAADRGAHFVDIRLSMFDAVDLRGIPSIKGDTTIWNRPGIWPTDETRETVLFFDEMDRAPLPVLNGALQIVLDLRVGEHPLPRSVRVVAAGNGMTDRGTQKLTGALADRFSHFFAEYDAEATRDHFAAIGVHSAIIAYLLMRPECGHVSAMKDAATARADGRAVTVDAGPAGPSPRSWETMNRYMGLPAERIAHHARAKMGDAVGNEFAAFLSSYGRMPAIRDILANPTGAPLPPETGLDGRPDPSGNYAVAVALAGAATRQNVDAVAAYVKRLPKEFEIMAITETVRQKPDLKETRAYAAFEIANQSVAA